MLNFDLETGERLFAAPPLKMKADEAMQFASKIPDCLRDIARSNCDVTFSPEFGCQYDNKLLPACKAEFKSLSRSFPTIVRRGIRRAEARWQFYEGLACIFPGEKGADEIVFDAGTIAAVNKLRFEAVKSAEAYVSSNAAQISLTSNRTRTAGTGMCTFTDDSSGSAYVKIPGRSTDEAAIFPPTRLTHRR